MAGDRPPSSLRSERFIWLMKNEEGRGHYNIHLPQRWKTPLTHSLSSRLPSWCTKNTGLSLLLFHPPHFLHIFSFRQIFCSLLPPPPPFPYLYVFLHWFMWGASFIPPFHFIISDLQFSLSLQNRMKTELSVNEDISSFLSSAIIIRRMKYQMNLDITKL